MAWDDGTAPSPVSPAGVREHFVYLRTSARSVFGLLLALLGEFTTSLLFARRFVTRDDHGAT